MLQTVMMGRSGLGQELESDRDGASLGIGRMFATSQSSETVNEAPSSQAAQHHTRKRRRSLLISPNPATQVPKPARRWAEGHQMSHCMPSYLFLAKGG